MTPDQKALIRVQFLQAGAQAIAAIFLSLYLFDQGGLRSVPLFFIGDYILQTAFFVVSGYVLRRWSTRTIVRIGLACAVGVYAALVALGSDANSYVFALGCLMGVADGFYWSGVNIAEYVSTHSENRNAYLSRLLAFRALMQVGAPLLAGSMMYAVTHVMSKQAAYNAVFGLLIAMCVAAALASRSMPALSGASYRFSDFRSERSLSWRWVLVQNVLRGLWTEPLTSVSAVLILFVLHTEFGVSVFVSCTTLLTAGTALVAGRALQKRPQTFWLGAIVVPIGLLAFGAGVGWPSILAFALLVQAFDPFADTSVMKSMYDAMDEHSSSWQERFHLVVEREAFLNAARIIGYLALYLALGPSDHVDGVRICLMVAAVLPLLTGLAQRRLDAGSGRRSRQLRWPDGRQP